MKKFIIIALFALFFSLPVRAETTWLGNAFVIAVPPACGTTVTVGDFNTILYRPAGVPLGNGADSYLALLGQRTSFTMLVPNNTFKPGINYASQYVTSLLNFGSNVGGILAWSMTPAVLSTATINARLVFTISNFFKITNCNPTFRADLGLAS
jgi:hypothetical protein